MTVVSASRSACAKVLKQSETSLTAYCPGIYYQQLNDKLNLYMQKIQDNEHAIELVNNALATMKTNNDTAIQGINALIGSVKDTNQKDVEHLTADLASTKASRVYG